MSHTRSTEAATARQVRQFQKKLAAKFTGKERGPDPEVRRDSYDVDDQRAKPWSPIGDGTKAGALGWIDCLLEVARDFDDLERAKGGARPLGRAIAVLEVLLGRRGRTRVPIDFRTGRLFPSIDTIAAAAGLCRVTVVRALAALKAHGFLRWVRRSQKTGRGREAGPQREQASNAYYFDLSALPKAVRLRMRQLWDRKLRAISAREGRPPSSVASPGTGPQSPALREALSRLGDLVVSASSPSSPAIPVQG